MKRGYCLWSSRPLPGARTLLVLTVLVLGLGIFGLVRPPLALAEAEVAHASAGAADDHTIALEAMRHDYNLQLVFALKGSGAYLADVKVGIRNAAGERVLATTSPGPLFFVSLPRGQYRVDAEFKGQQLSQSVRLAAGRRSELFFYWEHE